MIQKSQVMPLVLAGCPGFKSTWKKHQELWQGKEAGLYNDMGEFAAFIVDSYAREDIEAIGPAFAMVEELLVDRDEEVRAAAALGFLEDIQAVASHRAFGGAAFLQWLGPKSKVAWAKIEERWRGKSSLMDVVRAEQRAAKKKPKTWKFQTGVVFQFPRIPFIRPEIFISCFDAWLPPAPKLASLPPTYR